MYTENQIREALLEFDRTGSITDTIRRLGYPSRETMYNWLKGRCAGRRTPTNTAEHTASHIASHTKHSKREHASAELKLYAIRRCFGEGDEVRSVAREIGFTPNSIYKWRKRYIQKGVLGLLPPEHDIPRDEVILESQNANNSQPSKEMADLKELIREMQMDIDILKETINVLKKDPGADRAALSNREKAVIIGALSRFYSLPELLKKLGLPKSSYYYCKNAMSKPPKYMAERDVIQTMFHDNYECYGYRRIKALLERQQIVRSEKVVRRIMKDLGLKAIWGRRRIYSSYRGEISPEVPNLLSRDFHAPAPNEKWLTDITEFAIPAGKVYLSAIIDCYDGLVVSWNASASPNAHLANSTLDRAFAGLQAGHPIIHSDRGCHYRWPGWIERTEAMSLTRSMSKKGCSPDNAACEGFFGRLKNECFYNRSFTGYTIQMFIEYLNQYIEWYNTKRIKSSLGYSSPVEFRELHGVAA